MGLRPLPPLLPSSNYPPMKVISVTIPGWECRFCGTMDVKGSACPNCGAPRPKRRSEL